MRLLIATVVVALATVVVPISALAHHEVSHLNRPYHHVTKKAIWKVFGPKYARQALRVAWCESRLSPNAQNGQYLGVFQMGSWERSRYGHGKTALAQARAAHRYFVATGRKWGPWSCRWAAY